MSKDNPSAAGYSGGPLAPVRPPPRAQAQPAGPTPDDERFRQAAVEDLSLALSRSDDLLAHCQELADEGARDPLAPVHAAVRLMNAKAQVAKALAQLAQVERRSRTIVEKVQPPDPENAGLNATFASPQQRKKIRDMLERALLQFLEEQKKDRDGLTAGCRT